LHSIALDNVTKSYGASVVIAGASLFVDDQARIGVVGPNGAGKTTLLRLLAGLEQADTGRVRRTPDDLRVGYLPQELAERPGETLFEYLGRRTGVAAAEDEVERLAGRLGAEPELAERYSDGLDRFLALGGADLAARASAVCAEVGLEGRLAQPLASLSGGEAARARLAVLLLSRFDVYCLDEPTNDLDFDGLARLEGFVDRLRGSFVVISHDRAFLDRTIDRVVEIDESSGFVQEWPGNWSEYERRREHARVTAYRRFADVQDRRRELEALIRQRRGEARTGGSLAKRTGGADRCGTHALMTKVRQAERARERLERVDKPFEPWRLQLDLAAQDRSGDLVVRLERAVVERGAFRLGPLDLELRWGDRLVVSGPNGSGKTTLLGALLGTAPLSAGHRVVGHRVVIGELDQRRDRFSGEEPLTAAFPEEAGLTREASRTLLAKFALGADDVVRPAETLSPGERTRAALALLMAQGVNCLVLDEPTNHLDLPAIEELERALAEYEGTVVLVTHDRRLLERFEQTWRLAL
jgi:ATPase subunit of ABC transporter with duplicated ATPase domains